MVDKFVVVLIYQRYLEERTIRLVNWPSQKAIIVCF